MMMIRRGLQAFVTTDPQIDAVDGLEAAVAERQIVVGVAEGQRNPMRHVASVLVGEVRYCVLRQAAGNPDVRVARNALDVHHAVRSLLHRPYQRRRLRYCITQTQTQRIRYDTLFALKN